MKKINLKTISDSLSNLEMRAIRGGRGEDPCTVTCGNQTISVPYGDCVDIAWAYCSNPKNGYSCSNGCFNL